MGENEKNISKKLRKFRREKIEKVDNELEGNKKKKFKSWKLKQNENLKKIILRQVGKKPLATTFSLCACMDENCSLHMAMRLIRNP